MHTIAITSGKGGVGKTSVSANLGIALVQVGFRTVLFDADLQLANVDVALDVQPAYTLQHVVAGERTLAEAISRAPGGLGIVAGGSGISMLMTAGPKRMDTFLGQLDALGSQTDLMLFDTSAGLDNRVMTFIRAADEVVIVTTPDPTSVTDAYATVKVALKRAPEAKISLIVNMARDDGEGLAVFQTLSTICKRFLDFDISYLGTIRMDTSAAACIRSRKPFVLDAAEAPAAQDVRTIARKVQTRLTMSEHFAA